MRKLLFFGFALLAGRAFAVPPVVTPSTPVVKQGSTFQFQADAAGSWTCSGTNSTGGVTACAGSINSGTGLYTAPSSVTAQHMYGGMQVGPNNDVWHTRIDTLPVHALNTTWINAINAYGGTPGWHPDFPINYVLPSGSFANLNFHYTPVNNGNFEIPSFPSAKAEAGWFGALQNTSKDHHVVMVDTVTGTFSEIYQYFPTCSMTAASIASNIATITCAQNPVNNTFIVGSTVIVGGFTGSDTYFNVASATLTAVTATSISYPLVHANASASTNGSAGKAWTVDSTGLQNSASGISYSSMTYVLPRNNTTDAAGMPLQPMILGLQELKRAVTTGGTIHHAMRNTFALAVQASSYTWPATTFAVDGGTVPFGARARLKASVDISTYSAIAQVMLTSLKQYGTINSDGGNNWPMNAEKTAWPQSYFAAITQIAGAVNRNNMEFVDSSSMMVSTSSSLTQFNREKITFTRTSDSSSTVVDVALMGPAVNLPEDSMFFMAGTPAQQLVVLNNYGGVTWAMNPTVGSLTSGGLYTAPASVSGPTVTTVTVTSIINSSATAEMILTVFPSTGIFIIPSKTANYVDSTGTTWNAHTGLSNYPDDNTGCCACDNIASFPAVTDVALWNCRNGVSSDYGGDLHLDFVVPNWTYKVTYNYGTQYAVGGQYVKLSAAANEIANRIDPAITAGGQYRPYTSTATVVVTSNTLPYAVWNMNDTDSPISSFSIVPTTPTAAVAPSLSVVDTGSGISESVTVESSGQFRLTWEAGDNWGLSRWYDLVNDPTATTNLAGPVYAVNGPGSPCFAEPGLQNMTFYGDRDMKAFMRMAGCSYPTQPRSMSIVYSSASLVVLQTTAYPMDAIPEVDTNVLITHRFYIYPTGKIYVRNTITVSSATNLGSGGNDLFIATMGLEDPTQTGSVPPDTQGWIRSSADENPYVYNAGQEDYLFAYWEPTTPSPYTSYTKASLMLVPSPNNTTPLNQINHSWSSGTGHGVVRWGYRLSPGPNMAEGQSITNEFLLQLGTQNSSYLPNLINSTIADTIADPFIADPTFPTFPGEYSTSVGIKGNVRMNGRVQVR